MAAVDPTTLSPAHQLLLQKQQEHIGLLELREASAQVVARVEELAEMGNIVADGGEAISQVMRNWRHVFSVLNLFQAGQATADAANPNADTAQGQATAQADEPEEPLPQLVRLPYTGEPAQ